MFAIPSTTTALATLQSAGLVLALTPERGLKVTPASSLTPPLRELIKTHRDDLVRWLGRCASNDPASPEASEPPPAPAMVTSMVANVDATSPVNKAAVNSLVNRISPDWKELDRAYQSHHVACPTCISAGKGYGLRCGTGAALWAAYDVAEPAWASKVRAQVRNSQPEQIPAKPGIHASLLTEATDVENTRTAARLALFDAHGLRVDDAELLADKLLIRDREGDRRGCCAECHQLVGSGPGRWKCGDRSPSHINELAGAWVGAAFVHQNLHHCDSLEKAR